ncbi:CUB domain-containing protein, partial [Trichostrongylus colubriformis]
PAGCGETLAAGPTWKSRKVVLGDPANAVTLQPHAVCNDWITAPTGKKIEVQATVFKGVSCSYGCSRNGIEMKTLPNKLNTNPRACCADDLKKVFVSNLNPTPIITYNNLYQMEITYLYRYI